MAVLWMDNFKQFGTGASPGQANMLNGAYAEISGTSSPVADPDPTGDGLPVLFLQSTGAINHFVPQGRYVRKVVTPAATIGIGVRLWLSHLPSSNDIDVIPIAYTDSGNTCHVALKVSATGTIQAWRGSADGTLLGESAQVIVANAWQHIEAKVFVNDATGTVTVRVDNVPVLTLTGKDTKNSAVATIDNWVASVNTQGVAGPSMYVKDLVIWDTTGSINNDFLGNCFVASLIPDSDVSGTWTITGGSGSAFASIDEANPDDDTTYISSPFPAATADVCTVSDLPPEATTVKALMTLVRAKKSDGGDGNLQVSLVSNGDTGNGADRPLTTAYTYWSDIFETDPDTSAAWTVGAVNDVEIKFNRTA